MYFKRISAILLSIILCLSFAACGGKQNDGADPTVELPNSEFPAETPDETPSLPVQEMSVNPLTGLKTLEMGKENLRPVAVMINNIKKAQTVQTGVPKADIIYETEIEGGITRLMAVYKDISAAEKIGTIRSARVPYINLALGHDAVYVHCGIDPIYAEPYLPQSGITDFDLNKNPWGKYGFRESNGLSYEHTMYTSSAEINRGITERDIRSTTEKNTAWCDFIDPAAFTLPTGNAANKVTVKFSGAATSVFTYNSETKLYTKNSSDQPNRDYVTGESYDVTNVFVLATQIYNYPDGKHRKVELSGGKGYYCSGGAVEEIVWKKATAKSPVQFFTKTGSPLKVNAGKSYVCIHSGSMTPVFE